MRVRATTLIEVIVALALGLLLVMTVQSLAVSAHRTHSILSDRIASTRNSRVVEEILRYDLNNLAAPVGVEIRDGRLTIGGLLKLSSDRQAVRERISVTYAVEDATLVRLERESAEEEPRVARFIAGNEVSRFEALVHDGQAWRATWPTQVPRAVRAIRVIVTDTDQTHAVTVPISPIKWGRHDG